MSAPVTVPVLRGRVIVLTCDPDWKRDRYAEGPYGHVSCRLPLTPPGSLLPTMVSASTGDTAKQIVSNLRRKEEPMLWRFLAGTPPKGLDLAGWVVLDAAEMRARREAEPKRAYPYLALALAETLLLDRGAWPPPPTDDWSVAHTPEQAALPL